MDSTILLFGILPLLAFVLIDSFAGLRSGLIAGILIALAEAAYSLFFFGSIDELTIGSTLLIIVFGAISFKTKKDIYFKLQPVFIGLIFGAILLIMDFLDKPLLVMMMEKYQYMLPEEYRNQLSNPNMQILMKDLSGTLGYGFLIHAACVAYSAFKMNKWWWLIIRGIGLYLMMFLCAMISAMKLT